MASSDDIKVLRLVLKYMDLVARNIDDVEEAIKRLGEVDPA